MQHMSYMNVLEAIYLYNVLLCLGVNVTTDKRVTLPARCGAPFQVLHVCGGFATHPFFTDSIAPPTYCKA